MRRGLPDVCAAECRLRRDPSPPAASPPRNDRREEPFIGQKYDEARVGSQGKIASAGIGEVYCILALPGIENENHGLLSAGVQRSGGAGWRRGISQSLLDVPPRGEQHIGAAAGGA